MDFLTDFETWRSREMSTGPAGHELQCAGPIFRVVFDQKSVIFDRSIKRQNFIAGERRRLMGSNQLETALEIASCLRVASSDGLRLPPESPLWYPASGGGLVIFGVSRYQKRRRREEKIYFNREASNVI